MPWEEAIKAKLVINENTKRHPKESTKECGNCGTEHGRRTKNELCQHISRRVGNVESFHTLPSNVTARKRMIKIVQICPSFWQPRKWFGSVLCLPYHISAVDLDDPQSRVINNPQSRVWKLPAFSAWHWSAMQRYSSGVVQESHKGIWTWSGDSLKYSWPAEAVSLQL